MVHSVYILNDNQKGKKCFSFVQFENKDANFVLLFETTFWKIR